MWSMRRGGVIALAFGVSATWLCESINPASYIDDAFLSEQVLFSDEEVAKLNSREGKTWVAGRNSRFEGATLRDAKAFLLNVETTNVESINVSRPLSYNVASEMKPVPDEFDWRSDPRASNCPSLHEIRDQANCASCWAVAAVEVITDQICINSGGSIQPHISAQDVISCLKDASATAATSSDGCRGGVDWKTFKYYDEVGIVDGGNYGDKSMCYSYALSPCAHQVPSDKYPQCANRPASPPVCEFKCLDNGMDWERSKHFGSGVRICDNSERPIGSDECADKMKEHLYRIGPITAGFYQHRSLYSYKSGVWQIGNEEEDQRLGWHVSKILGYGTENETPYWLVANSWNSDWGDNGFFKILRGYNHGLIEEPIMNHGPHGAAPRLDSGSNLARRPWIV